MRQTENVRQILGKILYYPDNIWVATDTDTEKRHLDSKHNEYLYITMFKIKKIRY